jgi:hypothetical protein
LLSDGVRASREVDAAAAPADDAAAEDGAGGGDLDAVAFGEREGQGEKKIKSWRGQGSE